MGDVLADFADTGGVVVAFNFNWHTPPFNLAGRWMTGGYTPFNANAPTLFTDSTLGTFTDAHPLMLKVTRPQRPFPPRCGTRSRGDTGRGMGRRCAADSGQANGSRNQQLPG